MKSIFQKAVRYKEYYLRYKEWPYNFVGQMIDYKLNFLEYITILETDKFDRLFTKGEKVCIDNEVYTISELIYGVDVNIYRVKEYEVIEDEEQKQMVTEEYNKLVEKEMKEVEENRQEQIRIKQEEENRLQEIKERLKTPVFNVKQKEWWQFWK